MAEAAGRVVPDCCAHFADLAVAIGNRPCLAGKLFLGWFGPRGLAFILFTLIMMDEFDFPGEQELLACVSMTVFLSIMLHG
ncbi:hypothetical protein [Litoreibacter halocynthiae]|uniref:hypothetical protein n=1 Tax=Litoreibacter halocynthiae TaxID=1242689 RepID=UPI001FE91820|nr:hypothetical protein [Litoreibacter halocynthiae]